MTKEACTITLHMVSSLDGIVAKADNSVSWFETSSPYEQGVEGEDPETFLKTIDCYVMGARTYEHALALSEAYGWAYGDKPVLVVTHRDLPRHNPNVAFYAGDLSTLVRERLQPNYKQVWVVGGPILVNAFIRLQLAHDIRITVLPILLGEGRLLFEAPGQEQALYLKKVTAYKNGMVEFWYGFKGGE